ncbi:ribonuclease Z [Clostridium cavendishii DSM 21758]|uniref:Ribonuclease Z n=1 Tax=Clostridium cavendishii DSM 21758 TaxID=1121302 RepID=A0A1M6TAH1_9CLOT|nr:ribonuclease Z [Clostridium cavendishii]SHK53985.1 ribonuclease Z [Clostridium cavendishii DSM 21758]
MVDICLLGCGGGMPMHFRSLSASLINYKGRKILVDCGEGTQVSMRMVGWGFKTIDVICITHSHGDHTVGLPGLLATIGNSGRTEPLTIIGPKGIKRVVDGLRVIAEYLPYEVNVIENPKNLFLNIDKETLEIKENKGEINLSTLEVDHSSPCIGYSFYFNRERKFDVDKAIANSVPKKIWRYLQKGEDVEFEGTKYFCDMVLGESRRGIKLSLITDSRPTEESVNFIKDSDLFICEGTYGDDLDIEKAIKNKHMTFREAATLAKKGEVKKLLLTHFSPAMIEPNEYIDNAKSVFEQSFLGEDRLIENLKFI